MNIMTKRGTRDNIITYEHICDAMEDLPNIDPTQITLGSTALVLNGEGGGLEVYMANSFKEWKSLLSDGGGSSGGAGEAGLQIYICGNEEIDGNGLPSIAVPDTTTIYLVPNNTNTNDLYAEWVYVNDKWERFGGGSTSISLDGYATKEWVGQQGYLTSHQDISNLAKKSDIPSKVSQLQNDSGYITSFTESDPTVPAWAKASTKPTYTAAEVGALPSSTVIPTKVSDLTDDSGHYIKPSGGIPASDLAETYATQTYVDNALAAKVITVEGTTPTITAVADTQYICGEVTTLSFTPSVAGTCDVIFQSGAAATTLTVPNTVKFPEWFDASALDTNMIYEINITNGIYGAVMAWPAS